jgi:hypothetical protein
MKTQLIAYSLNGVITVPTTEEDAERQKQFFKQLEANLLKAIQDGCIGLGAQFTGDVALHDEALIGVSNRVDYLSPEEISKEVKEQELTNSVNRVIGDINDLLEKTEKKPMKRARGGLKGFKYPRRGNKMHWKTREKLIREGKLKK